MSCPGSPERQRRPQVSSPQRPHLQAPPRDSRLGAGEGDAPKGLREHVHPGGVADWPPQRLSASPHAVCRGLPSGWRFLAAGDRVSPHLGAGPPRFLNLDRGGQDGFCGAGRNLGALGKAPSPIVSSCSQLEPESALPGVPDARSATSRPLQGACWVRELAQRAEHPWGQRGREWGSRGGTGGSRTPHGSPWGHSQSRTD